MKKGPYNFLIETIQEAGEKLIPFYEQGVEVRIKNGDVKDFITNADIEINDFIIDKIKTVFPNHNIHSEESVLDIHDKSMPIWMIDPIDGTSNFSRQIPNFSISIGLIDKNEVVLGAVYNPITKELFSFEKGKGVYRNNIPVKISNIDELKKAFVFMRAGRKENLRKWGGNLYSSLLEKASKTYNLGSSALDICFIASGKIESVIYGSVSINDIAAAIGILKEAGGLVIDKDGEEINFDLNSNEPQTVIFANNHKISKQILEII